MNLPLQTGERCTFSKALHSTPLGGLGEVPLLHFPPEDLPVLLWVGGKQFFLGAAALHATSSLARQARDAKTTKAAPAIAVLSLLY